MRLIPALVLGYFTSVSSPAGEAPAAPLAAGMTRSAMAEIDQALGFGLAPKVGAFDPNLDTPKRLVTTGGRVVYLPNGCRTVSHPYDLVVHFHGAPQSLEPAFERSDIDAVFVILNLGLGSGRYDEAFRTAGTFDALLARTNAALKDMCPNAAAPKAARVALTAWSAGYGAVFRILDHERDASRVDAVLLADGLHASFEPGGRTEQRIAIEQIAPFLTFADQAAAGKKLFALTHSAITTPYASTTQTADFLLAQENAERVPANIPPPRPGMTPRTRGDARDFHVMGFDGGNEQAHCDHLHAFGDTLLPYLKQRWRSAS
jgi:hypothetical protein